ncbi:DUF7009 family protein [Flagellimonas pacifica]|uniref:Uncharacterized protein n=1 Tax=Flagellimonas pacifica TaxID=1247520 RepID=A0A285MWV1_9FLAO|nr:hypothetical protein [Allomuricauda parva]SNY99961.1 hypothetical protein SAMN06265377_1777 [Allomuricauda parva]
MKIRIKGNSVRYRLTRSEVETFCNTGHFAETTEFNGRTFTYAVKVSDTKAHMDAEFVDDTITLIVPATTCKGWYENEVVGFEHTLTLNNGNELFLLVEKDFICMDRTTEDQSDNYPNPRAM